MKTFGESAYLHYMYVKEEACLNCHNIQLHSVNLPKATTEDVKPR